ncbi:MAG: hypothetical protein ABI564_14960 [Ideonella sp.]
MRFFGSSGADAAHSSLLPALFSVLLAIGFWTLADTARVDLRGVESQVSSVQRTASRVSDDGEMVSLQASLENAKTQKAALMDRLQTTEPAQMIRAKIVYDLRQKCAATGAAVCSVRLADDTIATPGPTNGSNPSSAVSPAAGATDENKVKLIDLGIQKARAIVSGSFQNDEIAEFARRLLADPDAYWRINGVVVRGTTFEYDVERHIIALPSGGS